ncbi:hypothetical protein GGD61_006442 [Bradyrhizobium sp. SBR1B]|nr:hypothetical protein [Bradyrhizobium sp. SBR1B]
MPFGHFTWASGPNLSGRRSRNQRCEPPQVLGDGSKNKLVLGASWTAESEPAELEDALEVRKPHLDFLSLTSRLLKALGASEGGCNVSGVFMDVAWDLACGLFGQQCGLSGHTSQSILLAR